MGKTTLVNLFLEHLAGRPHTTFARGQCAMHYGAGEAYAPVLEAFGRVGREGTGRAVIRVLERCARMWLVHLPALVESEELERLQRQVRGATRDRMVRELNDALERLTAEDTLVLEDLHWSDVATLDQLAAAFAGLPHSGEEQDPERIEKRLEAALEAFDQARSRRADGDPEDPVRWELGDMSGPPSMSSPAPLKMRPRLFFERMTWSG